MKSLNMHRIMTTILALVIIGAMGFALFPSVSDALSLSDFTAPDPGPGVCVANCDGGGSSGGDSGYKPPPGPSPEQLKKEREKRDLNEATLDANDRGVEAFEKGDYARAIEYFKEALDYSPDDEDVQHNLKRAKDSLALAQANAAAIKGEKAGECFDKGCAPVFSSSNPPSSNVVDLSKTGRRPAMPEWMTKDPRYVQLDNEMKALEKQYNEKQEKLNKIDEQISRGVGDKNDLIMQRVRLKQGMSDDDGLLPKSL